MTIAPRVFVVTALKLVVASLVLVPSLSGGSAEDLPAIVQRGFDAYSAKGAEEAWRAWGLEGAQAAIGQRGELGAEDKAKFIAMIADAEKTYGRALGPELVRRFEVSASYQTVYVVWRFERRPLFCMFVCYRPRDDWQILNFFAGSDPREFLPESVSGMPLNPR
jgi:hypothetical protein